MNSNSHRSGSAVLVSGEICFRLTAHNHMGRLKKKFNYKFNSPTVTANCTWRRSSDFSRSIIVPRVDCNSDDRSFIVSRSSWRQKSSNSNQLRISSLKKMDTLVVVHLQLYAENPLFSIIPSRYQKLDLTTDILQRKMDFYYLIDYICCFFLISM